MLAHMLANIIDWKMSFYVKKVKIFVHLCLKNIVWVTFCQLEHYLLLSGPFYIYLWLVCEKYNLNIIVNIFPFKAVLTKLLFFETDVFKFYN